MPEPRAPDSLTGLSALVVEDEWVLAAGYKALLEGKGGDEPRALERLEGRRPDAVVLDLNLDGARPTALAGTLRDMKVPFVIVSGYERKQGSEAEFAAAPMLQKPIDPSALPSLLVELTKS